MPAAIATMTTQATTTDMPPLLRLLTWLSPAFPTGGFAYSHGFEWSIAAGDVVDEAGLRDWVADVLLYGSGRSDVILLRHAHATRSGELAALCALGAALGFGQERRLETLAQGEAFVRAAAPWPGPRLAALTDAHPVPYPIAVGALATDHGIDADLAAGAYAQAFAASLVSVAVRLIPLGQSAGLRVVAALEPVVAAVVEETRAAGLNDLGGAAFRADIAALKHETQQTRLFRT
jgi:urease accessory protein